MTRASGRPRAPGGSASTRSTAASAPRALPALLALVALASFFLATPGALAAPRPLDAPRVESPRVPPLPVEYEVRASETVSFAYHPSAHERVRALVAEADALRAEVTAALGGDLGRPVEVRIAALRAETERLAPVPMPPGATVLVLYDARLVVMSLDAGAAGTSFDLKRSLRHAFAHLAVDDAVGGRPVPRWFHEGYATWQAEERVAQRRAALSLAVLSDALLTLPDVEALLGADAEGRELATAQAAELTALLAQGGAEDGDGALPRLVHAVHAGASFERALADSYGLDAYGLERAHREAVGRSFGLVPVLATGGVVLALALALGLARRLRRARRARGEDPRDEPHDGDDAARGSKSGRAPRRRAPRVLLVGGRAIAESDELAEVVVREPEVPKVEHEGEWHTLH